jgi:molybdenum cofactor cytidylyltransferase
MGRNKPLFDVEGEPLVRRAVRRAAAGGLIPVLVVVGHEADRVQHALDGVSHRLVPNPDHERGITDSLRKGVAALPPEADAVMVVLADMPLVTAAMIAEMVERYRGGTAPLVISEYDGVNAPPMLYDRSLFEELAGTEAQGCGRHVVRRHQGEADTVRWPGAALTDLDVPDDYEKMLALLAGT